ncbi:hypothetical protein ABS825_20755, partial [Klebsiella pneumoniae]
GEGELMAHDVPLGCAPDEYDDLISGTCSHLPQSQVVCGATGINRQIAFIAAQEGHGVVKCLMI